MKRPDVSMDAVRYGYEQLQLMLDLLGDAVSDVPGVNWLSPRAASTTSTT